MAPQIKKKPEWFWTAADGAVAGISELLALLFGLPFGDDLYRDKPISGWHLFYFAVAILFAIGGPMWPYMRKKSWVSKNFIARVSAGATDPWNWVAMLVVLFLYTNSTFFVWNPGGWVDKSNRVIVDVTPETLLSFYEGRMGIEGDRLLAPYVGKWMKISGEIEDITSMLGVSSIGPMITLAHDRDKIPNAILNFSGDQKDRVATLRRKQRITALCMIFGSLIHTISLSNCELVEAGPMPPTDSK
jgi:hypothetical protein